jgi:hypothetical protein
VDERWHERRGGERFSATQDTNCYVKVLRDRTKGYVATQALGIAEERLRQTQEGRRDRTVHRRHCGVRRRNNYPPRSVSLRQRLKNPFDGALI